MLIKGNGLERTVLSQKNQSLDIKTLISREYWESIAIAKEELFKKGEDPKKNKYMRREIAESWIRSLNSGKSPDSLYFDSNIERANKEFELIWEENQTLVSAASPILDSFLELAAVEGYALSLFDKNGVFLVGTHLKIFSNAPAPNMSWNEKTTGATSTWLATFYKRPFLLIGPEHFLEVLANIIGYSAPILDEKGDVLGTLALTKKLENKPWDESLFRLHAHSFSWINSLAVAIGNQIKYDRSNRLLGDAILKISELERKSDSIALTKGLGTHFTFQDIIGESENLLRAEKLAKRFAMSNDSILLLGESGTGKELFAQSIHNQSKPNGPFIAVNCAAMPSNLIESELFGYESGAFTGAERNGRQGKVELANDGTLFLDEIGDMPIELQAVLLRVLQDKQVMRLGGKSFQKVNFRLITATNRDLWQLVQEKRFREDLYYRIAVLSIDIPRLRDREHDIVILAEYFIKNYALKRGWDIPKISPEAYRKILGYHWPGNVRQLENTMIYAVNLAEEGVIDLKHLPSELFTVHNITEPELHNHPNYSVKNETRDDPFSLKESEKKVLINALERSGKNIGNAAKLLNISKATMYRKLKEFRITY